MFIITPRQRPTHGLPGAPWEDLKQPATGATGLRRLLLCFFLFLKGCGDTVALVAGARAFSCVLAERRQRGQPRQAACGGASRCPPRIGHPPAERRRRRGGRRHPACGDGQSTTTPSFVHNPIRCPTSGLPTIRTTAVPVR